MAAPRTLYMKRKVVNPLGIYLDKYTRIGGKLIFPIPPVARLQTDGSFIYRTRAAKTAVLLTSRCGTTLYSDVQKIEAVSSTEAEWASIAKGIEFALEKEESILAVENDNLSVIAGLLDKSRANQSYARHYKQIIDKLVRNTAWTGIRWIPRQENRADDLFLK